MRTVICILVLAVALVGIFMLPELGCGSKSGTMPYDKMHIEFDNAMDNGYRCMNAGKLDSSMYYGGMMKAFYKAMYNK